MRLLNYLVILVLSFSLPSLTVVKSQNYFSKIYTTGTAGMSVNILPDGYLLTCNFQASPVWMLRTDINGNEIQKSYYSNFTSNEPDLTLLDGNRVFMGGIAIINDTLGICIVRLNTNGDTLWTKRYRKIGCQDISKGIVKSHDGNLVMAVRRRYFTPQRYDLIVYKLDTLGNILSEKLLYTRRNNSDWTSLRYADNEYYLSYYYPYERDWSDEDGAVMKTDTNFNIILHKQIGPKGVFSPYYESAYYVPMPNKQSAFIWKQDSTNGAWRPYSGQTNTAIFIFDSLGEKKTSHFFYDEGLASCVRTTESVRTMRNGDIVGVGKLSGTCTDGNYKGWIFRMSPTGKLKWERFIVDSLYFTQAPPYTWFLDVKETPERDLVISGLIRSGEPFFSPILIKVDSNGCLDNRRCDSADIKVSVASLNNEKHSMRVFPIPTSDQLNIDFDPIDGETEAEIHLYNLLGSKVGHYKWDMHNHPLSINVSNLPSGMYKAVLLTKRRSIASEKFIIVR